MTYTVNFNGADYSPLAGKLSIRFNISPPIPTLLHITIEGLYQLVKQKREEIIHPCRGGLFTVRDANLKEDSCTLLLHSGYGMINKEMLLKPSLTGGIYAIDNPYFGEEALPFKSIRDMVAYYFELIQKENLSLPDRIIGWSLGGVLAIELAVMIHQQQGYKPDVIMLDAYNWEVINNFYKRNALPNPLANTDNIDYLVSQSGNLDSELSKQLQNEIKHALTLLENHTPTRYGGSVVLLKASELSQDLMQLDSELSKLLANDNGWKDVVDPNKFQILPVLGNHYTLFNQEYIAELEKVFRLAVESSRKKSSETPFVSPMFSQQPFNKNDDNGCSFSPIKGCE